MLDGRREAPVGQRGDQAQRGVEQEPGALGLREVEMEAARTTGRPAARAPAAPAKVPIRLYQANSAVRSRGPDASASTACSVGRKRVTSPADGFTVPTNATTSSGQKEVAPAKPRPVAAISAAAPTRTARRRRRWASSPTARVSAAEPSSVAVTIAPIWNAEKPSRPR